MLLAILTITFIGTAVSWQYTFDTMEKEQIEEVETRTTALYDELLRQFAILDGYSASFTLDNIENQDALLETLERCAEKTEFSLICFAYPDGTLYRNDGATVQVTHRFYFQQALRGERVVEFLENNDIDSSSRMGMAIPVIINEEIRGVLLGLYGRDDFRNIFERIFSDDTSLTYLCDSTGNLLLGTQESEAFLAEYGLSFEDGSSSFMTILTNAVFSEGSRAEVENNMRSGQRGHIAYQYDGNRRHTTYVPLANGWYIVSVLHESQIYAETLGITGIFYGIILMVTLTALIVFFHLLKKERQHTQAETERAAEIQYLLEHDTLTDLLTGRAFQEKVRKRLEEPLSEEYCLIYLDIYKFKLINEMFGYAKGNELLCATAEELQRLTAQYDGLCARISGDHFILFLPHREEIMQKFRTRAYRQNRIVPLELYLHYGVYLIQNPELPVDQMIDCAQLAQRTVKGNYDDYISYFNDKIKEKVVREQDIITSMEAALKNEEFLIYLQPQYNYRTGRVCGAEALVRWNSPSKGLISPGDFIPVFESNGFIIQLDEYIWEKVCRLQNQWQDEGKEVLPISINVSRADLLKGAIAEKMTDLIQKYGLSPDLLRVEITESAYMDNPQQLILELNRLVDAGFTVEMDDFGSGYSSLNTLKDVPFQVLKTDLKFLANTGDFSRKDRILDGVIRMAHDMGMTVVAEGVETREQADYLLSLNCTQMQGYYFSRPVPVEQYEKLVYCIS